MRRPADAYWFRLKDRVKRRCYGKCEFCELRYGAQLHHRTYDREGCERQSDVMLVCDGCHKIIHRITGHLAYTVATGSLAHLGDSGMGTTRLWKRYLRKHPVKKPVVRRAI